MITEENLIKGLKKGNTEALSYFANSYSNLIYKIAFSVLNNKELSEEALNDALFKCFKNISSFKGDKNNFTKWVKVTAKYTAIDILRKEIKHGNKVSLEDFIKTQENITTDKNESQLMVDELLKEIDLMDRKSREIFLRRYLRGEKIKDIALSMNLKETNVSNRILRGKQKLKSIFGRGV